MSAFVLWLCRHRVGLWLRAQRWARWADRLCEWHIVRAYDRLCVQETKRP